MHTKSACEPLATFREKKALPENPRSAGRIGSPGEPRALAAAGAGRRNRGGCDRADQRGGPAGDLRRGDRGTEISPAGHGAGGCLSTLPVLFEGKGLGYGSTERFLGEETLFRGAL